jgi:hypothetical protein
MAHTPLHTKMLHLLLLLLLLIEHGEMVGCGSGKASIFAALEAVHATDRAANHGCVCCWKAGEREDHNWK